MGVDKWSFCPLKWWVGIQANLFHTIVKNSTVTLKIR
jgi:hypothetical protein